MYCLHCGYGVPASARFCRLCGSSLEPGVPPAGDYPSKHLALTIWNPTVAILWSWLLSPIFGSYIHMRNWLVLGEAERAVGARIWLYLSIGVQVLQFCSLVVRNDSFSRMTLWLLLFYFPTWYFSFAKKQRKYLRRNALDDYTAKPWAKVLTISVIGFVLYFFIAGLVVNTTRGSTIWRTRPTHTAPDVAALGDFAAVVPQEKEATPAPQDAGNAANSDTTAGPAQPEHEASVVSEKSLGSDALLDYINQEFAFGFQYPSSWVVAPQNTPNSRAHFVSPTGTPTAGCAVIVQRRPDIDGADQLSINAVFREPPSPIELKAALSQNFQAPEVISFKVGALGPLPAHDVRVTYAIGSDSSSAFMSGRMLTTASPGYIWTVSCGGVGATPASAEQAYSYWEDQINQLIMSFRFL